MALVADRTKETTSTTGAGDLALAGAVSGFQSINTAKGTNQLFPYTLLDANGIDWENGYGYLSAASTLVRQFIITSTNANAAISLSVGTHTVFINLIAETTTDPNIVKLVITANKLIPAGCCSYVSPYFEIASGVSLEIGSGSCFEIG